MLNGSGSLLWRLIETPKSRDDMVSYLEETFDVGEDVSTLDDVQAFLDRLVGHDMIETLDA